MLHLPRPGIVSQSYIGDLRVLTERRRLQGRGKRRSRFKYTTLDLSLRNKEVTRSRNPNRAHRLRATTCGMSTPDASAPPRPSALLANLPRHPKAPPSAAQNPVRVQASLTKALYIATHDRCQPPSDQIVQSERQNVLLRQFHARAPNDKFRSAKSVQVGRVMNAAARRHAGDVVI